jgi:hypothetical protein
MWDTEEGSVMNINRDRQTEFVVKEEKEEEM